jgi:hypothetical protein
VTSQLRGHKASHSRALLLGEGRGLWFEMSVARETELRELKTQTVITASLPPSDSERRVKIFNKAKDGAVFSCVSLPPGAQRRFQEGFLHFAFIIGPPGFPLYDGPLVAFPLDPSLLPLPVQTHRISLGSVLDIQIVTMWFPGSLQAPFILTWPPTIGASGPYG